MKALLASAALPAGLSEATAPLGGFEELQSLLARALVDSPPLAAQSGGFIRPGFSPELDALVDLRTNHRTHLEALLAKYKEATGQTLSDERRTRGLIRLRRAHQSQVAIESHCWSLLGTCVVGSVASAAGLDSRTNHGGPHALPHKREIPRGCARFLCGLRQASRRNSCNWSRTSIKQRIKR